MILCLLLAFTAAGAQPVTYTVANTHSHNDYEQKQPFWLAYREGFGSIEADIWLRGGQLIIGHDTNEIKMGRTLEEYYIKPLAACMEKNNGHPYADPGKELILLIDVKQDSVATLGKLVEVLKGYPSLTGSPLLKWVISGNRPRPEHYKEYPSFIWFDGVLHWSYSSEALEKIALMSDDLKHYTAWKGMDALPAADRQELEKAVTHSHQLHKPVRFWDAPDFSTAWDQLIRLKVDYINTDHIHELAGYLSNPANLSKLGGTDGGAAPGGGARVGSHL